MCCFSVAAAPAGFLARLFRRDAPLLVSDTRIFARLEGRTQWLVYAMSLATPADVAMVLPLPVAPGDREDALTFLDLSGYPSFFTDVQGLFPVPEPAALRGKGLRAFGPPQALAVHSVGSFEASFVPTRRDFERLDRRFRLPDGVWDAQPQYEAFGFAVFKLKKGAKKGIHPMAFRFETGESGAIFFPTLHVHDGEVHARADFDHALYYQLPEGASGEAIAPGGGAGRVDVSREVAGVRVEAERAAGTVDAGARVYQWQLRGSLANADAIVRVSPRERGPAAA
jgi:hypothetical protein